MAGFSFARNMLETVGGAHFLWFTCFLYLDVSENNGTPKSSISIGFSIINHPFGVPLFLQTPIWTYTNGLERRSSNIVFESFERGNAEIRTVALQELEHPPSGT